MYLTRSEYDRGVNTFSPEGRLFQVSNTQYFLRVCVFGLSSMFDFLFFYTFLVINQMRYPYY